MNDEFDLEIGGSPVGIGSVLVGVSPVGREVAIVIRII